MVVLTLVGAMMALLFQVLQTVWADTFSTNSSLQIKQFFQFGRDKSLASGKIVSMHIDLEKREMGMRFYDPVLEDSQDSAIYSLAEQISKVSYRVQRMLERIKESREEKLDKRDDQGEWLLESTMLPSDLSHIFSVGGLELIGPKIYVHFYPNGTSDSLLFEFNREERKYLYLPRYSLPSVYLDDLKVVEGNEETVSR